jgi:alkylation response protein AidB-like acyl-CoA dehydrogenase
MAEKFVSKRNLDFLLYEVFDAEALTRYPYFSDHSRETFDMVLDTAMKMGTEIMYPVLQEMDRNEPQYRDGKVTVHPIVREFLKLAGAGGWINAVKPYGLGGQQLPNMINFAASYIFTGANYSLSVYTHLSSGAANLISEFGSQELKDAYIEKLYSGSWQGTMALTEPRGELAR